MTRFTLDANCLIALEKNGPEAEAIGSLVAAHNSHRAHVALVGMRTADALTQDFQSFRAGLDMQGLSEVEILRPMAYYDLSFADWCIFPTEELEDIEREIHSILYPSIHYAWKDFRKSNEIEEAIPPRDCAWRHAKCDVQSVLAHMDNERDVFVTGAEIFHREIKKRQLIALGARTIATPDEAIGMI